MPRPNKARRSTMLPKQTRGIKKSASVKLVRVVILSEGAVALAASQAAGAADQPTKGINTFMCIPMSASGNAPVTHYACLMRVTPAKKADYTSQLFTGKTTVTELVSGQSFSAHIATLGLQRVPR